MSSKARNNAGIHSGIVFSSVSKSYEKERKVLDALSLHVAPGERVAICGKNGEGKTTILNIIATLSHPDQGEVEVFGLRQGAESEHIRNLVGYSFQDLILDRFFPVRKTIHLVGGFWGLSRLAIDEAIHQLGKKLDILDVLEKKGSQLSGGYKRRVQLLLALMKKPRILLLDEPNTGLDMQIRERTESLILDFLAEDPDRILILVSHDADEVGHLCKRVLFLERGKLAVNTEVESKQNVHDLFAAHLMARGGRP